MLKKLSKLEGVTVLNKKQQKDVKGGDDNAHVLAYCLNEYPVLTGDHITFTMTMHNIDDYIDCITDAYSFRGN